MATDRAAARQRLVAWIPRWWAGEGGVLGGVLDVALLPAEGLYRGIVALRNLGYERGGLRVVPSPLPVVSIGNISVGGAGKTPFAAWVARWYEEAGLRPAIVLRGYGEDEVLLHQELNSEIPIFTARRRIEAARAAHTAGCEVVVLDDGFQHRALVRDLDLVLVSVEAWQSHRRLLPRGPWREPASALRRAAAVVLTRKSAPAEQAASVRSQLARVAPGIPLVDCRITPAGLEPLHGDSPTPIDLDALERRHVLAVAGLANPEPFAANLRAAGATVELAAFPDHHSFSAADARLLSRRAAERPLIMTGKDAVKLRPLLPPRSEAYVLKQRVEIGDGHGLLRRYLESLLEHSVR
ncbi:MAG TPA: tetraacyldisaccharide 4'-kinase [Longimicrobiaceae bacterium]|nr:tetraacyldisaccharide 4'-kinase [Longimicrobiaceae bacterium]